MIVVLMGPAGVGKTTIGRALAAALRWRFHDADDLHSPGNIDRIRRGVPLTDQDRRPWLDRVREVIAGELAQGRNAVVACSALREEYRARIGAGLSGIQWVLLDAPAEVLHERIAARRGHFAGTAILASQLHALEPPSGALVISTDRPVQEIVARICAALTLPCGGEGGEF